MTTPAERVKAVFDRAAEMASPVDREAFLEQACGDAEVRARVEALLRAHAEAGSFLGHPPLGSPETASFVPGEGPTRISAPESPGAVIGPYKLLQQIGEGGMGTVFMAEQTEPVKRKVALKVIKPGIDSRQVVARFEAERQALSMMDHVNIARVLDAGATASGRPYFVMELIHGVPITKYCDDNHLTPRERLELFVPVCQAIQHAHQKGIIHRDIKPSNVLVTLYDGKPVPKVIDFGVAKAVEQSLTERTLFTQFGAMVGTPQYMSPEQAEMSALGIDTRSDIYSLGVLLYELLTGSTPLTRGRIREAAHAEVVRIIKEEEPPRPSTRLSESGEALASISAVRKTEPKKLSKLVRGELDWIAMKSLEKDRSRRYETASGFAADVLRYLADEPVLACPPSARYRLRKFARRNRAAVLVGVNLLAVLLIGVAGTTWGLVRAERAREEAIRAQRAEADQRQVAQTNEANAVAAATAEKAAKEVALAREAETNEVLDFVEGKIFAAGRPKGQDGGLGREVTLHRAIEAALPFVDRNFKEQPLIEARLRMSLGTSFHYLGEADKATEQYRAARKLYTQQLGPDHPDTLRSTNNLAGGYTQLGRYAEALKLHEETLALFRAKLGPGHPDTLASMNNLANTYSALGRRADALQLRESALALCKAKLGADHPVTLSSMNNLADSYAGLGRREDAVKLREDTLERSTVKFGRGHPDTLRSMRTLADSYSDSGRSAEAFKLYEEVVALAKVRLGVDHPDTIRSMGNLAAAYADQRRYADALKLHEAIPALWRAKFGPDHPDTLMSLNNLAANYNALGRHAEAVKLYRETLGLRKAKLGADHPDTLTSMHNLAANYADSGRHAEALKLNEETLTLRKAKLGADHPDTLVTMHNLARNYTQLGRYADALKLHGETLTLRKAKLGPDDPDTLNSMNEVAWLLATCPDPKLRDPLKAVELAKTAAEIDPKNSGYANTLGVARYRAGEWKAAVAALETSMNLSGGGDGVDWFFLAMAHGQLGQKAEARRWYDQAVTWMEKSKPKDDELQRFRKEAADLLQIREPPKEIPMKK